MKITKKECINKNGIDTEILQKKKKEYKDNSYKNKTKGDKQKLKENDKTTEAQEKLYSEIFIFVAYSIKDDQSSFDIRILQLINVNATILKVGLIT